MFRFTVIVVGLTLVGGACRSQETSPEQAAATAAAASAARAPTVFADMGRTTVGSGRPTTVIPTPVGHDTVFSIPVGPSLEIIPGKGIGPVRFGATVETVERLMEGSCSARAPGLCRYVAQAVDFRLEDGVVTRIEIHGDERQFDDNPKHTYGIFNGRFRQKVRLGMYRSFVIEGLGEPLQSEEIREKSGRFDTVTRDFYPNMILEYDRLRNGNVVLAGVVLAKDKLAGTPGKGASAPKESASSRQTP